MHLCLWGHRTRTRPAASALISHPPPTWPFVRRFQSAGLFDVLRASAANPARTHSALRRLTVLVNQMLPAPDVAPLPQFAGYQVPSLAAVPHAGVGLSAALSTQRAVR